MPVKAPKFVQGDSCDAIAEYRRFVEATENSATDLLAELGVLQKYGSRSELSPVDDKATKVTNLFCRKCEDWVVFYTANWGLPFEITVVLADRLEGKKFDRLEAEAARRLELLD